jgi:hypothetical protein
MADQVGADVFTGKLILTRTLHLIFLRVSASHNGAEVIVYDD